MNVAINQKKCQFCTQSIEILGYIVENKSKRPNPDRLSALLNFPLPEDASSLRRLLGFFAYNAKWVENYSNKVIPILETLNQCSFPLSTACIDAIKNIKEDITNSCLTLPVRSNGFLKIETDASGGAIGAVLSQNGCPITYHSRTLNASERNQSVIEREAAAIIDAVRKWSQYIQAYRTIIVTDQRSIAYIFSSNKSRIKNEKLSRWRLELSSYPFEITYREGRLNTLADTLSRVAAVSESKLKHFHDSLAHPGVTRMWDFVQRYRLPYSVAEVKKVIGQCRTCRECKPVFFKPPKSNKLIKSNKPFERLSIVIVGPKQISSSQNRFFLSVIDEYSRFPFAFPLYQVTSSSIINCLKSIFSVFGVPQFIHSDRGTQFMSTEFRNFCQMSGISISRTTPYHPNGNGQCEKYNGVISKAITCLLHSRNLPQSAWDKVLPEALSSIRGLLCTATGETPHSRLFQFDRRSSFGQSLPSWLQNDKPAFLKNFVRNKDDAIVTPVQIQETINPHYARVQFPNGRVDTVSTSDVAPGVQPVHSSEPPEEEISNQPEEEDACISKEDACRSEEEGAVKLAVRPQRTRKRPNRYSDYFL